MRMKEGQNKDKIAESLYNDSELWKRCSAEHKPSSMPFMYLIFKKEVKLFIDVWRQRC